MTLRLAIPRLLGLAVLTLLLAVLAACDSSSAPPAAATPIGAAPTATAGIGAALPASPPTASSDQQMPQAVGTAGAVPTAQPTGGAAQVPQPVATGSPVLITPGAVDPDEPPRISLEELQALLLKPDTLLVDVRSQLGYEEGHIKGAVSFPFPTIEQHIQDVPKDKLIVAYCQ